VYTKNGYKKLFSNTSVKTRTTLFFTLSKIFLNYEMIFNY